MNLKTPKELIDESKPYTPNRICGLYFLIDDGEIVYVGQSKDVTRRLEDHAKNKEFDSVTVMPCEAEDMDRLEAAYIRAINPPLNRHQPFDKDWIALDKFTEQFLMTSGDRKPWILREAKRLPFTTLYGVKYIKREDTYELIMPPELRS